MTGQSPHTVINLLSELGHGDTGFCDSLHVLTNLAMNLGSLSVVAEKVISHISYGG
jgi:hypothetical protein